MPTNPPKEFLTPVSGVEMNDIAANLPESLAQILAPHEDANEYLTALMTTLVVSGSIIPNVSAVYDRRRTYPMLMLFVICPPAGGKGVVNLPGKLLEPINRHLAETYKAEKAAYQLALEAYKTAFKSGTQGMPPVQPKRRQLLVPGNITSSKMIQQIDDNGALALVMLESEADVLSGAFKSEHGKLMSTLIRQAYHHERISLSRKTNDEWIEIENPKMAMVIAGTDNQIMSIFGSNQDGLFSRFMFLRNNTSLEWRNVNPKAGGKPLDDHYREWSKWYFQVWEKSQHLTAEVRFTDTQWDLINKDGQEHQATSYLAGGEYAVSIARRHALMTIRTAIILTFFRHVDPNTGDLNCPDGGWVCDDRDFMIAQKLTSLSYRDTMELFRVMPQAKNVSFVNTKRVAFWLALPKGFTMEVVNIIAKKHSIPERSKTRWIKEFCDAGALEKTNRGEYRQTEMAAMALTALSQAA